MFYYFPHNYVWSSAFTLALMAGGQLNQMDRWLAPLRDTGPEPDPDAWTKAWDSMGEEQSRHAAQERADGYVYAASARYFRAATYHLTGERQTPPGSAKTHSYTAALSRWTCDDHDNAPVRTASPRLPGEIRQRRPACSKGKQPRPGSNLKEYCMRAIGLTEFGGPDVLHIVDLPVPEPSPGEVRIRVHAVAVNPIDATFRAGSRAAQLADRTPPYIPGVDAAGVVDMPGPGTSGRLSAGDRVIALVIPMGPHGGTYAEQIITDERSVIRAPKDTTDAEAATLLLNAVAAHLALDALDLKAGQVVAVTGAAGAVGGYAIQLARARGLTVIADASPDDEDLVRALGADHVIARGDGLTGQIRRLVPGHAKYSTIARPITDPGTVTRVVEDFRARYGARELAEYYPNPNPDVAVEVTLK